MSKNEKMLDRIFQYALCIKKLLSWGDQGNTVFKHESLHSNLWKGRITLTYYNK